MDNYASEYRYYCHFKSAFHRLSRNERNHYHYLSASQLGYSNGTTGDEPEEGGDDVT
jgi:hypothetical protein